MKGRDVPEQPKIKAIETHYNGYRFRSRLEARVAVLFDALGVKYRYETEGYRFDGLSYLPDFHLPAWDIFVEVKGCEIPTYEQVYKPAVFAVRIEKPVLLIRGDLLPEEPMMWLPPNMPLPSPGPDGNPIRYVMSSWLQCPLCSTVGLMYRVPLINPAPKDEVTYEFHQTRCDFGHPRASKHCIAGEQIIAVKMEKLQAEGQRRIESAYTSARSARFEHGENGRPRR